MTWWMWFAAGMVTVVAALMLAALVSRLFREPAAHRAGIGEDEDAPEPTLPPQLRVGDEVDLEATGKFVTAPLHIQPNLYPRGESEPIAEWEREFLRNQPPNLGPPPTYPETPEEHTR
jgi:hypothetical protein